MSSAVASVAELVGDELATAMSKDNPAAVVRGEPIPFRPIATAPKKRKKWLFF
jgi:hypothetical protein